MIMQCAFRDVKGKAGMIGWAYARRNVVPGLLTNNYG